VEKKTFIGKEVQRLVYELAHLKGGENVVESFHDIFNKSLEVSGIDPEDLGEEAVGVLRCVLMSIKALGHHLHTEVFNRFEKDFPQYKEIGNYQLRIGITELHDVFVEAAPPKD